MAEKTVKALDPRGSINDILQAPLAPRPDTLDGKTLYIVESWGGSTAGFDEIIQMLKTYLTGKYKDLKIENRKRLLYSSDDPPLWAEMEKNADAYVYFAAPSCSTTAYAVTWPARAIERRGIPGCVVMYTYLQPDADMSKDREGMEIRTVDIHYPCDDIPMADKEDCIRRIEEAIFAERTPKELEAGLRHPVQPPRFCAEGTEDELQEYFQANGLTDGLPVIIPTEERVEAMLKGTSHPRDEVVCTQMAPEGRKVTVEQVAINAVMAGALPCYMPVLLACTELMGRDESFHATPKSTNSFSFMQVVNGPIRKEIGMNDSVYALGAGNRANAVIGRFHRLALTNLGGGVVGVNMMGVQGNVSTYTFAFAENEEASPWHESFAERHGFRKDESVLTIFTGGWSHAGNFMLKKGLDEMIRAVMGFEYIRGVTILLAPRRAEILAAEGIDSLEAVEEHIWKRLSLPKAEIVKRGISPHIMRDIKGNNGEWPADYLDVPDDTVLPIFSRKQVHVVIVGDPQGSDVIQAWSMYSPASIGIDKWR